MSVPYLPGSSIKGLMRAWAEQWGGLSDQEEVKRLFGTETGEAHCGALMVFDALPSQPPKLEIDILNPHYSEYYQNPTNPPADYLSPKPVFFLTVAPKQGFEFFLASRKAASKQAQRDLETGLKLLLAALETLGTGGKTAVGYGTFKESKKAEQKCGAKFRAEQAAQQQRELDEIQHTENLSPLERELKIELENFLETVTNHQEWDTRLLKELENARWTGDKAKLVAKKIKELMGETDKWCPDFGGSNKQKRKLKERSLKVLNYIND